MSRCPAVVSLADEHPAVGGVAAVDRALSLLATFGDGTPMMSLAELAQRTRLYKSTALRLLASLEHAQLVLRQPDGRYALGPGVPRLHMAYTQSFSFESLVMPALRELVVATRESAAFHVLQGKHRLCLYRVDSPQPVRDNICAGDLLPPNRGVGGRVLQAYSDAGDKELGQRIRHDQVVMLTGDREPQLAVIAAPVFGPSSHLVGAVILSMPRERLKYAWTTTVRKTAQALTEQLGGVFPAPEAMPPETT